MTSGAVMLRTMRLLLLCVVAITVLLPGCAGDGDAKALPTAVVRIEGSDGRMHELTVEVASTEPQRQQGLMYRQELGGDEGMLFTWGGEPSATGFWMRNTYVPLDIAYLGPDGEVQEIRQGEPLNEELLRPAIPYFYVIEVNEGWFEERGLGTGDRFELPE